MDIQTKSIRKPPVQASRLTLCKTSANGVSITTRTRLASQKFELFLLTCNKLYFSMLIYERSCFKHHVMSHFVIQRMYKCLMVAWKPIFCVSNCKTHMFLLYRLSLSLLYIFLFYVCNCLKISGLSK